MNVNKYPFTEEQMRQVFDTSLVDYAIRNGFRLKESDSRTFKIEKMGGLFIFKNGKGFYHFTTSKKGNILDFAKEYLGLDFKQAVESILGIRVYENNIAKYCSLRSSSAKSNFRKDIESSDKQYGFNFNGTSQNLYVFEAPIDLMSHMTLFKLENKIDWKKDNRVSCGSLSDMAIDTYLKWHKNIENIIFCFDNDFESKENYGQNKAKELSKKYKDLGYKCYLQIPKNKDFNQDLVERIEKINSKVNNRYNTRDDEFER